MNVSDEFILLKDALALMGERDRDGFPKPFTLNYVTCDMQRKTGGHMVKGRFVMESSRINSKMYKNALRHIYGVPGGKMVPVHIYLITKINGKWVV